MEELHQHTEAVPPTPRKGPPRAYKVTPGADRRIVTDVSAATDTVQSAGAEAALYQNALTETSRPVSATTTAAVPSRPTCVPEPADNTQLKRRLRHEEKYDRITLYLEKQVHKELRTRYDSGEVENLSSLFNAAVKNYLAKHFGI